MGSVRHFQISDWELVLTNDSIGVGIHNDYIKRFNGFSMISLFVFQGTILLLCRFTRALAATLMLEAINNNNAALCEIVKLNRLLICCF